MLIEGYGSSDQWPYGFEINGPGGFTVSDVTMWGGGGAAWNLNSRTSPSNWSFTDCVADMTLGTITGSTDQPRPLMANGMNGTTWTNCVFTPWARHSDA